MPYFGRTSKQRLLECDHRLQRLFNEIIKHYDCTVLCGHRDRKEQDRLFSQGLSKLEFPHSKHNVFPSLAVDVAPYPINWNDREEFYHFGGFVMGVAASMGIKLRWGGDWDMDTDFHDQTFMDLPHFELVEINDDN